MSPRREKTRASSLRPLEPKAVERRRRTPPAELDPTPRESRARHCVLRLYVAGASRASRHAIERVRALCEGELEGRYVLEVIDVYQLPALAKDGQLVATPTLIRVLPAPPRRFVGDPSRVESVLFGLDLREKT